MTTTIKSNSDGSSAIQTNGVDRIQIDTSGIPLLVATPSTGDNSKKIATTEFVSNTALGVGQTWQNLIASRAFGTTYTNSTGRTIYVSVTVVISNGTNNSTLVCDGIKVAQIGMGTTSGSATLHGVIPSGKTYRVDNLNNTLDAWSELR